MAVTLEQARLLIAGHEDEYQIRHEAFRALRRFWHGDYWKIAQEGANGSRSITSIFRDLGKNSQQAFPDIKLVHNVVQEVCVKYQTFLSPLPMIQVYIDPPETDNRKNQATIKERFLYGLWNSGKMSKRFREIGWFLPLMGDSFIGCFPDFDRRYSVPIVRSPEHAYPIKSFAGDGEDTILFKWQERDSILAKTFPGYQSVREQNRGKFPYVGRQQRGKNVDPIVDVVEFSDNNEFARWAGDQQLNGVDHSFGFNIFEHLKFIDVPGEVWGHGAVEQAINLNEMGNALYSLLFQAILENVFPTLVLVDPSKAPEEIMRGPGSVIPINAGGSVEWLHPPVAAIQSQIGFMGQNINTIKEATGMPPVSFGESPATSIVTGAAINELQGAGTGSTVEMVQSGIGLGMTEWNAKAIYIQQNLFRDDKVTLHAAIPTTAMDMRGRYQGVSVKGSQLVGSGHNEVVFSPAMNQHEKLVMWLQAKGGGLVSDRFIRNQIGVPDSEAMDEEILGEEIQRGVLGFYLNQLQSPDQAPQLEQQAVQYIEGITPPGENPAPHPLLAAPAGTGPTGGPSPLPGGPAPMPGGGTVSAPPLQLPPGAPQPQSGAPSGVAPAPGGPAAAGGNPVTVAQAMQAFQGVTLQGQAWLVGQIAAEGKTADPVEIAYTDTADQQTLQQAPFPTILHRVAAAPSEQAVEINPKS